MGLLTIALALGWLVVAWRRRSQLARRIALATTGLTGILVAALAFGVPSPLNVFGYAFSWPPSRVLWELIPAFRVPSRWIVMIMTALVPLAALGLQTAWSALGRRGPAKRGVGLPQLALVGAAMAVSFFELTTEPVDRLARTTPTPPEYAAVARTPDGVLAEYPLRTSDIYNLWQREHRRRLLNGAPPGAPANDASQAVLDPAAPGTAAALAALGVTSIVVHPGTADVEVVPRSPSEGSGFELVERFDDGSSVWTVTAAPAPGVAFFRAPDFGVPHATDGVVLHPLSGSNGQLDILAKSAGVVSIGFEAVPAPGTQAIRVVGEDGETTIELEGRGAVSLDVAVPEGRSRLTIWVEPPPEGGGVGVELSSPRVTPASGPPVVRAVPVGP